MYALLCRYCPWSVQGSTAYQLDPPGIFLIGLDCVLDWKASCCDGPWDKQDLFPTNRGWIQKRLVGIPWCSQYKSNIVLPPRLVRLHGTFARGNGGIAGWFAQVDTSTIKVLSLVATQRRPRLSSQSDRHLVRHDESSTLASRLGHEAPTRSNLPVRTI